MENIRWGVIGCGWIAKKFAKSLAALPTGELYAGASRSEGRAEAYAEEFGCKAYTDYEPMLADPKIDAVYVATTHNFHFDNVKCCLEHGKHVLCEKPITVSARQAKELFDLAAGKKLFIMEAMWTRFLPALQNMQQMLRDGVIGEVLSVRADFCVGGNEFSPESRMRNKALAGGSILDLGVYPITFADMVLDAVPESVKGDAFIGDTDVDDRSYYQLAYPGGKFAQLCSSFTTCAPIFGMVMGSKGYIELPFFFHASEFTVCRPGGERETFEFPFEMEEGFKFEIDHAMQCIAAGKTESDVHPPAQTLKIMEIMDTLRGQWNLKYDGE